MKKEKILLAVALFLLAVALFLLIVVAGGRNICVLEGCGGPDSGSSRTIYSGERRPDLRRRIYRPH